MWTDLREEIEKICRYNNLAQNQFQALKLNEWQEVQFKIHQVFHKTIRQTATSMWFWENLKLESKALSTKKKPYLYLDGLIDKSETVWFFVNETVNESVKYWYYQGLVSAIQTIVAEASYIDEVYLVSKKYEWLLCINHHEILIASGKTMTDKLRILESQLNRLDRNV